MLLPITSAHDPVAGESGRDPLGLEVAASRLSDLYLPGITSRMSRARALTIAALSSYVCEPFIEESTDDGTPAYLVFEWLWVTAMADADPEQVVGVPGVERARSVARRGERLCRANYLKGAGALGIHGAYRTLARSLGVVDADGRVGDEGLTLLKHWSASPGRRGFLEAKGEGGELLDTVRGTLRASIRTGAGQKGGRSIELLRAHSTPDTAAARAAERRALRQLLEKDATRRATVELVEAAAISDSELAPRDGLLATLEKARELGTHRDITAALEAFNAFESLSRSLTVGFDVLRHASWEAGRVPRPADALANSTVGAIGQSMRREIADCRRALKPLPSSDAGAAHEVLAAFADVRDGASLANALVQRHLLVQASRGGGRSSWFQSTPSHEIAVRSAYALHEPPELTDDYVHPDRITNLVLLMEGL